MPIPQSQLDTWAHQGAITTSSRAYASIRHALLQTTSPLTNRNVEIFLQGSYANSTNIYADSDIDVVVLCKDTFYKDMSALTPTQREMHEIVFPPATYLWSQLRDDVVAALRSHYGNHAVTRKTKAINVETGCGGRPSDVIPAMQFRRYATFLDRTNLTAHWGIQFFDSQNNSIVNYPKYHIERGEDKNQASRTQRQYKANIRIFKKLRNYLVENSLLAEGLAPSYCIECALYNVPDILFVGNYVATIPRILHYLTNTPCSGFKCQNGVVPLIGSGSTQWSAGALTAFVTAAQHAWDNW